MAFTSKSKTVVPVPAITTAFQPSRKVKGEVKVTSFPPRRMAQKLHTSLALISHCSKLVIWPLVAARKARICNLWQGGHVPC